MDARRAAACARCGKVGKLRQIDDVIGFFLKQIIDVVLCDRCNDALIYADATEWEWFRQYRDR